MKLDLLAFGAHPDDVELGCGGVIAKAVAQGKKVGIVDLTKGELSSRGNLELRAKESEAAAEILGVSFRKNLNFKDGFISRKSQIRILRDNIVIHKGQISSLKRFKEEVSEVKSGFECGVMLDNYSDIKVGDIIETFEEVSTSRKL